MDKSYFEMNDAEKQLNLISNNIDYAICVFSEGLPVTMDSSTLTNKIIELQMKIVDKLFDASRDIKSLLKIVEEKEDKP